VSPNVGDIVDFDAISRLTISRSFLKTSAIKIETWKAGSVKFAVTV